MNKIIVRMSGGLGNQMFEYAFGQYYSFIHNVEVLYDTSWYDDVTQQNSSATPRNLDILNFNIQIATPKCSFIYSCLCNANTLWERIFRRVLLLLPRYKYISEDYPFHYDESLLKNYGTDTIISGYFCSHKYISPIRDNLLKMYTLKSPLSENSRLIKDLITSSNSVSIHVRRGDYLKYASTFELCDNFYYDKAIRFIREKVEDPTFFVFSDDINYCKSVFEGEEFVFVNGNEGDKSVEDLILMSICRYNIIANSTFSFWGAWLNVHNNKLVIAPKKWLVNEAHPEKNMLIPTEWIRI